MVVAVPQYIKLITYNDDVVGFLLGFPDVSAALQRGGRITPWGIADIMLEFKKHDSSRSTGWACCPSTRGAGVALLYNEMAKLLQQSSFAEGELTQMAETAIQVRRN